MTTFETPKHTARLCLKSLACLLVLATAQPAMAQPATPKGDADKSAAARADELAQQGAKAAAEGDLEGARKKLAQAFELKPAYDIAGNLGGVEYGLQRYREAAEHLSFSLSIYPVTGNDAQRIQTESFLKGARSKLCSVALQGLPPGTSVLIDGSRNAALDQPPLYLEPGQHTLTLNAPGYETLRKQYACTAGDSAALRIQMEHTPAPKTPKPDQGEGKAVGPTESAAKHESMAKDVGGAPLWPVVLGSSLTLAAAGAGTGMWFLRRNEKREADKTLNDLQTTTDALYPCSPSLISTNPQPNCDTIQKSRDQEVLFENLSVAAFITGGAAALATLGYLVGYSVSLGPKDESDQIPTASFQFTPSNITFDISF